MVRRFGDDPLPAIRRDLAETLLERGRLLVDEGRRDEALAVLADVVARGAGDDDPDIHRYVGSAFTARPSFCTATIGRARSPPSTRSWRASAT